MVAGPTVDLNNRKIAVNSDGSISTVRSISIEVGSDLDHKRTVLIPTVIDGKVVSNEEAIKHYRKTDEHLGIFKTEEDAERFAKDLHEQQDEFYTKHKDYFLKKQKEEEDMRKIEEMKVISGKELTDLIRNIDKKIKKK